MEIVVGLQLRPVRLNFSQLEPAGVVETSTTSRSNLAVLIAIHSCLAPAGPGKVYLVPGPKRTGEVIRATAMSDRSPETSPGPFSLAFQSGSSVEPDAKSAADHLPYHRPMSPSSQAFLRLSTSMIHEKKPFFFGGHGQQTGGHSQQLLQGSQGAAQLGAHGAAQLGAQLSQQGAGAAQLGAQHSAGAAQLGAQVLQPRSSLCSE